ncbi:ubiquinol-cytochrome C chaperone family protein [Sphingobium nicotianae]|uniref:Ubiquinol-cytochrome C chaperone n=1 Tax=Sphingobium nicotianae TaxID=2782607 RepID=A0A9X1DA98_9SPHN|nr:ubiquinol-cytochrome C chaperone family protein [Sphingobium nicotianae]MBT2186295.1 ubiquinol-cytochrome C chaperone [Sphingobium nicotianae]
MSFLSSLFNRKDDRAALRPLYEAVIATARAPHWYLEGGVADTLDGRFDMVAAVLSLVLMRLEALDANTESVKLTELFITDMDGQIRQIGFGDLVVGKQVGKMVGALGGRLAAYRAGLTGEASLAEALVRNLYRGEAPAADELAYAEARLRALADGLAGQDLPALLAGNLAA